jgi:hypothetical protein
MYWLITTILNSFIQNKTGERNRLFYQLMTTFQGRDCRGEYRINRGYSWMKWWERVGDDRRLRNSISLKHKPRTVLSQDRWWADQNQLLPAHELGPFHFFIHSFVIPYNNVNISFSFLYIISFLFPYIFFPPTNYFPPHLLCAVQCPLSDDQRSL